MNNETIDIKRKAAILGCYAVVKLCQDIKTTPSDMMEMVSTNIKQFDSDEIESDSSAWAEYDAAADWCAARGIAGTTQSPLPENISARAMELISIDPEAFQRRIRETAYSRAERRT